VIKTLSVEQICAFLKATPEQALFDWKRDLRLAGVQDPKKAELVKDVAAIANATWTGPGFIFYGVDPGGPDPVVGLSEGHDDAQIQQLLADKIDPQVQFLYYEVKAMEKRIGVIHVDQSLTRPHLVARDFGGLKAGQYLIRQGSSTRPGIRKDLMELFYGRQSPYLGAVLKQYGVDALRMQAAANYSRVLQDEQKTLLRQMEASMGLPHGSLG
jgi:predicted HTH transcriptional regulator